MPRFLYATRRLGCYQHGCPGSVVVITPDWYARVVEGRGFKSRSGYYKFFFLYFFLHFNVYFNMLRIYIYKKKTLRVMGNTYCPGDSIPRDNDPPYIMLGVCLSKHARTCCHWSPLSSSLNGVGFGQPIFHINDTQHSHPFTFATSSEKEHRPASSVALTEFVTPLHTHTCVTPFHQIYTASIFGHKNNR